jgi:hypothetical protein
LQGIPRFPHRTSVRHPGALGLPGSIAQLCQLARSTAASKFAGSGDQWGCADPFVERNLAALKNLVSATLIPVDSLESPSPSDGSDILTIGRTNASKELQMRTMEWKRGVGVACLLMTFSAAESRAQTRGPIQEPAGIPVVKDGMKTLGSPFSPEYQGAWYQSQANRIAAMAWMEHDIAMRQAYIAELAARKAEADASAKSEKAEKAGENMNGKVMWTKVGKPAGWGLGIGKGKIISSTRIPESKMVVDATPVNMDSKSTIVVESPKMTIKDATPMPTDKATASMPVDKVVPGTVISETYYEVKPDGTMVEMKPSKDAKITTIGPATPPAAIASQPSKTSTKR